jgi:tetratricopeptide (TPR) repeat protein
MDRLETLKSILAARPADTFARYGLAMEYVTTGDYESAVTEFRALLAASPDQLSAYFQAGQTLEKLGHPQEAIQLYTQGIEAATRQGNTHARDQMQTALELLS